MSPSATTIYDLGDVKFLPLKYDSQNSQTTALKLIHTLMPDWASGDSNVELVRFTDGITNTLLKAVNRRPGLSKSDIDRDAVLLRAYGSGTAILIDREREAANHELLMRYNLAPELLARFENGMLYRYIPGLVASPPDLSNPSISKAIARRLAEWHATVPCLHGSPKGISNGGANQNGYLNGSTNGSHNHNGGYNGQSNANLIANAAPGKPYPNVWTTMQKWILALPRDTEQQRQRQSLLQQEFDELVERLGQRPGLGNNGVSTGIPSQRRPEARLYRGQQGSGKNPTLCHFKARAGASRWIYKEGGLTLT